MKTIKFLSSVIALFGLLLSACAPSAVSTDSANVGGGKSVADVVFTGVIESMDGDQWVINGQTINVDASVLRDGTFQVGDTVKVEAEVAEDGSVTAQRIETPSAADLAGMDSSGSDSNGNDDNTNSDNANDVNSNDNDADDDTDETVGTVEAITDTSITVGGQTYTFAEGVEIKDEIVAGAVVKLEFTTNADGTLSVTEIEIADPSQIGDDNENDDNSNAVNENDDDSNDDNEDDSNDDNGDVDSGDDNGNDSGGGNDNG